MDCCPQSPKLSLDLSPPSPPLSTKRTDETASSVELKANIARLEAELRKIEAFQRELPLSVIILNEAIAKLKEEEASRNGNRKCWNTTTSVAVAPPPPEFCWKVGTAKLKSYNDEEEEEDDDDDRADKKSWMSSAQLWSSSSGGGDDRADRTSCSQLKSTTKQQQQPDDSNDETIQNTVLDKELSLSTTAREERDASASASASAAASLSLNGGELRLMVRECPPVVNGGRKQQQQQQIGCTDQVTKSSSPPIQHHHNHQQHGMMFKSSCARKQRRCWSPELHRRFVDALEKLGGSQVATPKQIREVMRVDGLTNDEVKSHLQKYRLHIRKLPNTTMSLSRSAEDSDDSSSNNKRGASRRRKDDNSDANHSTASPEGPLLYSSSSVRGRRPTSSISGASRCSFEQEQQMRDAEDEERSDGMSVQKSRL